MKKNFLAFTLLFWAFNLFALSAFADSSLRLPRMKALDFYERVRFAIQDAELSAPDKVFELENVKVIPISSNLCHVRFEYKGREVWIENAPEVLQVVQQIRANSSRTPASQTPSVQFKKALLNPAQVEFTR